MSNFGWRFFVGKISKKWMKLQTKKIFHGSIPKSTKPAARVDNYLCT